MIKKAIITYDSRLNFTCVLSNMFVKIIQSEREGDREMRVTSWREILPAAAPSNAHCDALCRCQLSEQHNKLCMFVDLIEHLAKLKCILLRSLR